MDSRTALDGAENLALTGILSLDQPTRSESLYRLRYFGPEWNCLWSRLQIHATCAGALCLVAFIFRLCAYFSFVKTKKIKLLFSLVLPDFRKNIVFRKVLRLRPFALLVRTTCK